jgi:hypothetical protein
MRRRGLIMTAATCMVLMGCSATGNNTAKTEEWKMADTPELIPVLQLTDLEALKAAQVHLAKDGYVTKVGPFSELPKSQYEDWMTPANGGYLFYLEKAKYKPAMNMLGKFFGCTE